MSSAAQKKTDEFQIFLQAMQDVLGVVVSEEMQHSANGKLLPIMAANGYDSLEALAEAMRDEAASDLCSNVLQAITEHEAVWFDYPEVAKLMNDYVLPAIVNKKSTAFRIWLVGCGQGQIAYSLAMTIDAFQQQYSMGCNIEIIATDLSEQVVKRASIGRFASSALMGLSEANKRRYLTEKEGLWEVDDTLRSLVHFTTCDLRGGVDSMGRCDLIICPDELVYFSTSVKKEILESFAELLDASGILIVGAGESVIPFCDQFKIVNHESGTFYRQIPSM